LESSSRNLIRWNDDGTKIEIVDKKKFSKEVLPKFFRTSNFSSFVRQLNFYRFTKCVEKDKADKAGKWVFMHENFLRDHPELKTRIKRRTYQDQEAAREISSLQETVRALVQRVETLESMVGVQRENVSPLSPAKKKRKRSFEDFEQMQQQQQDTRTISALPSDVMSMDLDWNTNSTSSNNINNNNKIESTVELSEFLEGMDFEETRKKMLPRPSLIRSPSWETVCENVSLPGDISTQDAAKVGELLSVLMPQIQAALLSQMQNSSMTTPVSSSVL
jgi:hypothetical protein